MPTWILIAFTGLGGVAYVMIGVYVGTH
jgi:hypothetical protein